MVNPFVISDKNSRSSKIKNAVLKRIKMHSLSKSNLIIVIGGDGFMLETLKKFNIFPRIIFGFLSGLISAPMGITGAMMNVPILRYFGYPINLAIGSSAAIGFIIALFGSIGFFTSGLMLNADIPLSIGFINIPAFIIFVPITTFMARIGAKTVQDLDRVKTQRLFGVFLYVIGTLFLYRFLVT